MSMHTDRFTERVGDYIVARPSYPPEAIAAMLAGLDVSAKLVVADVGAGTGISSRAVADAGPHVLAIEPNAAMRNAAHPDPRIEWIDGTAEATTLAAASVDIVAAFQAWHWVDHAIATAEARRIVRPGGRLVVVFNERDESDPFTAGYGDIVRKYATDATEERRARALYHASTIDPANTTRLEFPNTQSLDRAGVHKRTESSSYAPHSGPLHDAMHAEIDALVDSVPGSNPRCDMRLATIVVRVEFP
jgi:SAM-dependent methyltransferase